MEDIALGAHLITPRRGYTHHGIYAGEGVVIHYSGLATGLQAGPVAETSLESFCGDASLSIREYAKQRFSEQEIVARARSRLGESEYDLHTNNCEHFCVWAITGRPVSEQVETVEDFLAVVVPPPLILAIRARRYVKQKANVHDIAQEWSRRVRRHVPFLAPVLASVKRLGQSLKARNKPDA